MTLQTETLALDCRATRRESIFDGRQASCYAQRPATIAQVFADTVAAHPDRVALVHEGARLDYRTLDQQVTGFAMALLQMGLPRGARVALLLENVPEFLICTLGAVRAGMIVVPLNVRQSPRENDYALNQCRASVLVCSAAVKDQLPAAADTPNLQRILWVGDKTHGDALSGVIAAAGAASAGAAATSFPTPQPEDCWCILYTSGTTGNPKGAMITHLGAVHSIMAYRQAYGLTERDVSILAVPASHATGLLAVLLPLMAGGGCTVMMDRFKADAFLRLAEAERMSHAIMVPAMYNLCLLEPDIAARDLTAWRVAAFGGAPMPPATIEKMARLLPQTALSNAYGATETTSPATILPLGMIADHPDSVGRPVPCADIVVVDDAGAPCPPDQIGEVMIGGPMTVPGYWDNPKAGQSEFDAQGRWKSGDLGYFDSAGFLHVVDRRKDVVNRGGYKIYCIEVEAILTRHDAITEAAVTAAPDPILGERIVAHICASDPDLGADSLKPFCAGLLSSYKIPDLFIFRTDPLPRNANGKVLKKELRNETPANRG